MNNILNTVLNYKVSYQRNTWASFSKELTVQKVVEEIRSETLSSQITHLRELYSKEDYQSYNAEKLRLPAVTFCGTFDTERKKEKLVKYNELIVIDIDKLTYDQIIDVEKQLLNDNYVVSYWRSPSNFGIKGLVPLKYNFDYSDIDIAHKSAFDKLYEYFLNTYNIELDRSGSDTTRLCFMSYDTKIIIKSNISFFNIEKEDLDIRITTKEKINAKIKVFDKSKRNALFNPHNRNKNTDKRQVKDIITYLKKRNIVITGEYEQRYKIAYAIANTFTFEIGKIFFLELCKIETEKFNETRELKLLEYCYEKNAGIIKFNYIEELVKQKYGYIKKTLEKAFSNGTNQ